MNPVPRKTVVAMRVLLRARQRLEAAAGRCRAVSARRWVAASPCVSARRLAATALCVFALVAPPVFARAVAVEPDDLIGTAARYATQGSDTLLDIARSYDLGYVAIRAANPAVDPWLPPVGTELLLPTQHVLPQAPRRGIVINLPELRLYYFPPKGGAPLSFPIGIGGEGKETPLGSTEVVRKQQHPTWVPTASEREEDPELPLEVAPGEDNPMGDYALYLGRRGYAIHGSNRPYSIGRRDSHGCIRLYPEDIETLYALVTVGTPVMVVEQEVKLGWSGGQLYLEIHPNQAAVDVIEAGEPLPPRNDSHIDELVLQYALAVAARLDWPAIYAAERQRSGVAVRITR